GINVVPIVNLLGHTEYLIRVPELRDLNELRAPDGSPLEHGQICPLHPRTLEIAEKLLRDMAPFCTAGKVHVGLDESFHLGKHPLSKAEISRIGLAAHFAGHVNRLRDLTRSLDLRMGMWADMLCFLPEAIPLLPRDLIAYDWFYFPFPRLPRVELYNFREYDLAAPLLAHGIEYWGCPMNGSFRYEPMPLFNDRLGNISSWWRRCAKVGATGMLVSSWEPHRLAMEMTTVVDAAAASLWLESSTPDPLSMLAKGFERALGVTSKTSRTVARAALQSDQHAFVGYPRWEINEHWDSVSPRESLVAYTRGERFHAGLAKQSLPAPFAFSATFAKYLYARDIFVRRAARGVLRLRRFREKKAQFGEHLHGLLIETVRFERVLREGREAAAAMWLRTRRRDPSNPNRVILRSDAARLRDWRRWLKRCADNRDFAHTSAPVIGALQLLLTVHNFEPALQKIVLEQQLPDGTWRELRSRFTIEFCANAAAPRSSIKREFSMPIAAGTESSLHLRIGVRGVGRVRVSDAVLIDGTVVQLPKKPLSPAGNIIGCAAPRKGLPDLQWNQNVGVDLVLSFDRA
ncbi:MAG TPA: glycoside hydrolase family 20, partial [Opitutus sp.]|nr:glycoside hydrolase family 20 [Opitutus sp.]